MSIEWSKLLLLGLMVTAFIGPLDAAEPYQCKKSKTPLFQEELKPIEMELTSDFEKINEVGLYPEEAKSTLSEGTLKYFDRELGDNLEIKVKVRARGGYRFEECDYRPLKVKVSKKEKKRIKKIAPKNLFRKMGRTIKITGVCSSQGPEDSRRSLLKELYVYKLLGTLDVLAIKVRLIKLTLRRPDGSHYLTDYAFIREAPNKMAKRCGLESEPMVYTGWDNENNRTRHFTMDEERNKTPYLYKSDPRSRFQAELINHFIRNDDYSFTLRHNIINLLGPARICTTETPDCVSIYHLTYDYDLGLVVDGGMYSSTHTDRESAKFFQQWIEEYPLDKKSKKKEIRPFVQQRDAMISLIDDSVFLDQQGKEQLLDWISAYLDVLERYLR